MSGSHGEEEAPPAPSPSLAFSSSPDRPGSEPQSPVIAKKRLPTADASKQSPTIAMTPPVRKSERLPTAAASSSGLRESDGDEDGKKSEGSELPSAARPSIFVPPKSPPSSLSTLGSTLQAGIAALASASGFKYDKNSTASIFSGIDMAAAGQDVNSWYDSPDRPPEQPLPAPPGLEPVPKPFTVWPPGQKPAPSRAPGTAGADLPTAGSPGKIGNSLWGRLDPSAASFVPNDCLPTADDQRPQPAADRPNIVPTYIGTPRGEACEENEDQPIDPMSNPS